jgi:hypothetical protein
MNKSHHPLDGRGLKTTERLCEWAIVCEWDEKWNG